MSENNNFNSDKKKISLKNLYLDPNNYRFIDNKNYKKVEIEDITKDSIQKRTLNFLVGEKRKGIENLLKSFKANGFLPVDQIQVDHLSNGKYRVLEGNRRVATLKILYEDYKNQSCDLVKLDPKIFSEVPIIIYKASHAGEHEIIMGLKHISGNKKWPPLNQAQLIFDLINKHNWTEAKARESLGITTLELRRSLRAISLIKDYKESDFGDQFETDMFGVFREIVSSQPLKSWIDWDDNKKLPKNKINTEKLYSWLSEIEETNLNDNDEESVVKREAIITKSTEISTLSRIINDPEAIKELEEKRNITEAYSASSFIGDDKYIKAIANIEHNIDDASSFSKYAKQVDKEKLIELRNKLEGLLVGQGHKDIIITKGIAKRILVDYKTNQFESITLNKFKGFQEGLKFKNLNRINLFAGENNVGKSSLLEAIYLITNQNDVNSLIELYRRRGKFQNSLPVDWLVKEFNNYNIEALFDGKIVKTESVKFDEEDLSIEKSDYLKTLEISSIFNGDNPSITKTRLFERKQMEQFYEEIRCICSSSFSSPFTMLSKELINEYHEISIQRGTYSKIIKFINEHIDNQINKITKVGDTNQIRFLVEHSNFEQPIDLTQFGEGLQRIFYISLQIASAKNGIMCIDELENAIHHSLLIQFSRFIQIMAEEFNVQLFITTHSQECIKAFIENEYHNDQITGYRLIKESDGIKYKAAKGSVLKKQIETFNLDLRG
jgi:AAA15 family ATPase/GTPase